ncbi:unnamed protein product [Ilex paraguariensis]|uniref:Large ribosomal subunit protein bL34c n=1 Tax=Ilex paraguariensis TaxID=185542 RepID=A0ABC8RT62_9AQUA
MACVSVGTWLYPRDGGIQTRGPSASLTLLTGSRTGTSVSMATKTQSRSGRLRCFFVPSSSSLSLSSTSSFSGLSLGLGLNSGVGVRPNKGRGLVVRAGKPALCLTKRNRSRKSLARTHGFRKRMSTTSGRALIKRRRAKGRWVLCPKSNHNSGKRP